jgi:hypothetical protein
MESLAEALGLYQEQPIQKIAPEPEIPEPRPVNTKEVKSLSRLFPEGLFATRISARSVMFDWTTLCPNEHQLANTRFASLSSKTLGKYYFSYRNLIIARSEFSMLYDSIFL